MSKTVAILQSNYIPWKGYFDIINAVDAFVLYDDCQFTRRDWRNRNKIKTPQGVAWLTVPVRSRGNFIAPINTIEIDGVSWREKHAATLKHQYAKAPAFKEIWPRIQAAYGDCLQTTLLSEVNYRFIREVCAILRIDTPLLWSHELGVKEEDPSERLAAICSRLGATAYLSGPAARDYLDEEVFRIRGMDVLWMRYDAYQQYPQLHPPFRHDVTVLDVLFNVGSSAARDLVCRYDTGARNQAASDGKDECANLPQIPLEEH